MTGKYPSNPITTCKHPSPVFRRAPSFLKKAPLSVWTAVLLVCLLSPGIRSENYEELELSSRNLVLPENEQFNLGAKLFKEDGKKLAAWKAFQTFLFNYADSPLAADAQFMLAESIFAKAVEEMRSGTPPDEFAWHKDKRSGMKLLGKGFKKSFEGLRDLSAKISGEEAPAKEPDRIDVATFSEAVIQYDRVAKKYRKSGLADTALFRIAECYYNMGDYPNALLYFKELQKDHPQSYLVGESILGAAQCYIPGGDFGSAELEIKRLLTAYPSYQNTPSIQFILGIIRYQEGRYEEAVKHLESIQTPESIFYSGQALVKMGKALSATGKFKKVIAEFKDSRFAEQAAYLMGDSFFLSQNYQAAIAEFKQFIKAYPRSPLKEVALYRIGACSFLSKDYPGARQNFNLFINAYPSGEYVTLARYFIAESYRLAGQLKEAAFAYGQLISAMPNAPITANARFKLAWVTYLQENYASAADLFQKFVDWHPFHTWLPQAYLLMGNCYAFTGRVEQAAYDYQQAFDRAPKTELAEAAMALLNRTRYEQGSYGQLTSGYTYILKSLPPIESKWRAYSQLYLADSYYRQNLYKEAIGVFQTVVSLYPNHPAAIQALDGLSWCYFQLGDFDQAQKERERISGVRLPAGVHVAMPLSSTYELANALFNQKKYAEALKQYEKAIQESPSSEDVPDAIYRIGLCSYRQEFYSQAITTWQQLARRFPDHQLTEDAGFQIADTYFRAQKYDSAVETYRQIVARYPDHKDIVLATLRIGQSYYNAGDDKNAISELEAFLRKYPKDAKSPETLDLLEGSINRQEAANPALRPAGTAVLRGLISAFPNSPLASECQFRIARRFFSWKDYDGAAAEFEKVIVTYPDSSHMSESQFYAAECYYNLKKYDKAIPAFRRFVANFSDSEFSAAAWFHLGTSHFNTSDFEAAIEAYSSLIRLYPDSEFTSAAYNNLALAQKKMQKLTEAADTYSKLALNFPDDPYAVEALLESAKLKKELERYGEAILVFRDLENRFPPGDDRKLEVLASIGECYLASNDPEEAVRTFRALADAAGSNVNWKLEAFRQMGEIYEKQAKWSEAVSVYMEGGRTGGNPQVSKSFRDRAQYLKDAYLSGSDLKTTGQGQ